MVALKAASFIPPVVALVIVAGWAGYQKQKLVQVEAENRAMTRAIARATGAGEAGGEAGAQKALAAAKGKEKIDWKKVANDFMEMQQGGAIRDVRAMIRLQKQIQELSRDDMVAALDEIGGLGLPADSESILEQMLLGQLVEKDPEYALTRLVDRMGDERGLYGWQLSEALAKWARKDLSAAGAWLDREIAAGKFESKALDGKSGSRTRFEGRLIAILLGSDAGAAGTRLAGVPENQREDVLRDVGQGELRAETQAAYAALVRGQVAANKQTRAIADPVSNLVSEEGFSKVNEYLERIQATPAERSACVEEAAERKMDRRPDGSKVTREEIDSIREWVSSQSAGDTEEITGKVLGKATRSFSKMEFSEAAKMARDYHEASGDDQLLTGFLENSTARQHKEEARELVELIADPEVKEQFQKRFK